MSNALSHAEVNEWMERLKSVWISKDVDGAVQLFDRTEKYFERPFNPGTTPAEIRKYWEDVVGIFDIALDYLILAVEGRTACVQYDNWFKEEVDGAVVHLNGVFVFELDDDRQCTLFRQWWFMEN